MEINYREWLYSDARVCARARQRGRAQPPPRALQVLPACCATCEKKKKEKKKTDKDRTEAE